MDGDSTKKRAREAKAKTNQQQQKKKRTTTTTIEADCFDDDVEKKFNLPPAPARELGVFEFPWQKEGRPIGGEIDGGGGSNDLRDVFFASLVDGCRAAIGFPGDRLSPTPAPIDIPDYGGSWPSDAEPDGIWSCALREPLFVYSKTSLV